MNRPSLIGLCSQRFSSAVSHPKDDVFQAQNHSSSRALPFVRWCLGGKVGPCWVSPLMGTALTIGSCSYPDLTRLLTAKQGGCAMIDEWNYSWNSVSYGITTKPAFLRTTWDAIFLFKREFRQCIWFLIVKNRKNVILLYAMCALILWRVLTWSLVICQLRNEHF